MTVYGDSGSLTWGWAAEVTGGTAVAAAHYLVPELGGHAADFDPGETPIDVSSGNPFTTIAIVNKTGHSTWSVQNHPLFPSLGLDFLTQMGLVSGTGFAAPGYTTITESYGTGLQAYQYPGSKMELFTLASSPASGVVWSASGSGISRSIGVSALAAPTIASEDPYTHDSLGSVTLVSGGSNAADISSLDLSVALVHAKGQGNAGVPLVNIMKYSRIVVTFKIGLFLTSVTIAEYNAMKLAGGTAGALSGTFTHPNATNSVAFNIAHAKYLNGPIKVPKDGLAFVTLTGHAFRTANNTQPVVFTVV